MIWCSYCHHVLCPANTLANTNILANTPAIFLQIYCNDYPYIHWCHMCKDSPVATRPSLVVQRPSTSCPSDCITLKAEKISSQRGSLNKNTQMKTNQFWSAKNQNLKRILFAIFYFLIKLAPIFCDPKCIQAKCTRPQ